MSDIIEHLEREREALIARADADPASFSQGIVGPLDEDMQCVYNELSRDLPEDVDVRISRVTSGVIASKHATRLYNADLFMPDPPVECFTDPERLERWQDAVRPGAEFGYAMFVDQYRRIERDIETKQEPGGITATQPIKTEQVYRRGTVKTDPEKWEEIADLVQAEAFNLPNHLTKPQKWDAMATMVRDRTGVDYKGDTLRKKMHANGNFSMP